MVLDQIGQQAPRTSVPHLSPRKASVIFGQEIPVPTVTSAHHPCVDLSVPEGCAR